MGLVNKILEEAKDNFFTPRKMDDRIANAGPAMQHFLAMKPKVKAVTKTVEEGIKEIMALSPFKETFKLKSHEERKMTDGSGRIIKGYSFVITPLAKGKIEFTHRPTIKKIFRQKAKSILKGYEVITNDYDNEFEVDIYPLDANGVSDVIKHIFDTNFPYKVSIKGKRRTIHDIWGDGSEILEEVYMDVSRMHQELFYLNDKGTICFYCYKDKPNPQFDRLAMGFKNKADYLKYKNAISQ